VAGEDTLGKPCALPIKQHGTKLGLVCNLLLQSRQLNLRVINDEENANQIYWVKSSQPLHLASLGRLCGGPTPKFQNIESATLNLVLRQ
jgi:hypothetical protein